MDGKHNPDTGGIHDISVQRYYSQDFGLVQVVVGQEAAREELQ